MATIGGPNTEKDGLVFGYDTGYGVNNTATNSRYYQGKPTSNLSNDMTKYFNNWSGMTGSTSYYTTDRGNQGIHLITTNSGGVQFYASSTIYNISANTQYTVSATIKYNGTTPHVNMFYIRQYHNGSQITEGGKFSTSFMIDLGGGWYRAYRTFTTTSTTSYINLQGYQYSNGVNLKIQDLQFEIGNQLSPYIGSLGTRTSTESLIDLKRTTDIDVSNTSFDSTGQPDFDGTSDYINITNYTQHQSSTGTIEAVVKLHTISGNRYVFGAGGTYTYGATRALRVNNSYWGIVTYGSGTEDWGTGVAASTTDWQHVAFGWSGTTVYFYINGVRTSTTRSGLVTPLGNVLRAGMPPWGIGSATDGEIAIMKHYSRVLTETEMKENFNAYKNRFNI